MEVVEVVDGVWGCVGCIRFGDVAGWYFGFVLDIGRCCRWSYRLWPLIGLVEMGGWQVWVGLAIGFLPRDRSLQ